MLLRIALLVVSLCAVGGTSLSQAKSPDQPFSQFNDMTIEELVGMRVLKKDQNTPQTKARTWYLLTRCSAAMMVWRDTLKPFSYVEKRTLISLEKKAFKLMGGAMKIADDLGDEGHAGTKLLFKQMLIFNRELELREPFDGDVYGTVFMNDQEVCEKIADGKL